MSNIVDLCSSEANWGGMRGQPRLRPRPGPRLEPAWAALTLPWRPASCRPRLSRINHSNPTPAIKSTAGRRETNATHHADGAAIAARGAHRSPHRAAFRSALDSGAIQKNSQPVGRPHREVATTGAYGTARRAGSSHGNVLSLVQSVSVCMKLAREAGGQHGSSS